MGLFLNIHSGQQSPKSAMTGRGLPCNQKGDMALHLPHGFLALQGQQTWRGWAPAWHESPHRFCLVRTVTEKKVCYYFWAILGIYIQVDKIGVVIYIFCIENIYYCVFSVFPLCFLFLIIFLYIRNISPLICYIGCTILSPLFICPKFCSGQIILLCRHFKFSCDQICCSFRTSWCYTMLRKAFSISTLIKILILPGSLLLILCESLGSNFFLFKCLKRDLAYLFSNLNDWNKWNENKVWSLSNILSFLPLRWQSKEGLRRDRRDYTSLYFCHFSK